VRIFVSIGVSYIIYLIEELLQHPVCPLVVIVPGLGGIAHISSVQGNLQHQYTVIVRLQPTTIICFVLFFFSERERHIHNFKKKEKKKVRCVLGVCDVKRSVSVKTGASIFCFESIVCMFYFIFLFKLTSFVCNSECLQRSKISAVIGHVRCQYKLDQHALEQLLVSGTQ
jgi:hypothetical protein